MKIGLDLGDTIFDRTKEGLKVGKNIAMRLFPGVHNVLCKLVEQGHELFVVSKIDQGHEARVAFSLSHAGITPHLIDLNSVRFCYHRRAKGPIANELELDVFVDDRIECLNSVHQFGVAKKILFVGSRDDRILFEAPNPAFNSMLIAKNWLEVFNHVSLPEVALSR